MVGRAVVEHCTAQGDSVLACDRTALDITDRQQVEAFFDRERPEVVINCAAWTDVDACELDKERAFAVNEMGPQNLAVNCRRTGARLITISTDYVFDGTKKGFYTQDDQPNPLNEYGRSKWGGEVRAGRACPSTTVVRTGWVFGEGGKNFLSTAVNRVRSGERLKLITDAWGTPTYTRDLAKRLRELAKLNIPGIFHVVNSGAGASYEEFARSCLSGIPHDPLQLESVSASALQRRAARPVNSRLSCLRSEAAGLAPLPDWQEAVKDFVARVTGARRSDI
jgi:dTDP-4-dehydrorhamnose reductase